MLNAFVWVLPKIMFESSKDFIIMFESMCSTKTGTHFSNDSFFVVAQRKKKATSLTENCKHVCCTCHSKKGGQKQKKILSFLGCRSFFFFFWLDAFEAFTNAHVRPSVKFLCNQCFCGEEKFVSKLAKLPTNNVVKIQKLMIILRLVSFVIFPMH